MTVALPVLQFLWFALVAGFVVHLRARRQRQALLDELRRAHDEARRETVRKSAFLAAMSHEIRTPMNSVLGLMGLLQTTKLDGEQRRLLSTAEESATGLLEIIDDILDFSRIEAGRLTLDDGEVDVRAVVQGVVSLLAEQARSKGLQLTTAFGPNVPVLIRGDAGRLRQVLLNLAGNALKFTAEGSVGIDVAMHGETLRVEVRDTGIGISEEARGRLFSWFSQADTATTAIYGGSGLGLAISRRLIELMGGSIDVESTLGQGSTFWFSIPVEDISTPATRAPTPAARRLRVLVVDDNPTNRELLSQTLQLWRTTVVLAESGPEALVKLRAAASREQPFHVAVLDHEMDEMNGLELAAAIRSDRAIAGTRLVLLSSSSRMLDARAARRAGLSAWLTKPAATDDLHDAVFGRAGTDFEAAPPAGVLPVSDRLEVLVAEDNPVNQQVAARMLELRGCVPTIVGDGLAAVDAVRTGRFDAVLMDCQMPGLDGFDATRAIRSLPGPASAIPIVALTASALPADAELSLVAGMDAHITKPVGWDDAVALLRELVAARAAGMPAPTLASPLEVPAVLVATLDRAVLEEMRALGRGQGDALVARLSTTFLTSTVKRLHDAHAAVAASDAAALRAIAHSLRGAAATFGANRLAQLASELHDHVAGGDAAVQPLVDAIDAEFALVRDELAAMEAEQLARPAGS